MALIANFIGPLQTPAPWLAEASFWLALASVLTAAAGAVGIWALVSGLRELRAGTQRLNVLQEIDHKLARLVADREDLDLRRIEHVLLDLRDTQRRLEDALLRTFEARSLPSSPGRELAPVPLPESIGERVVNRLLSLGYEQVEIVTRFEKLAELARSDGEVLVEAKREGVLHKGRVSLRLGRLADVEMTPTYSIFP